MGAGTEHRRTGLLRRTRRTLGGRACPHLGPGRRARPPQRRTPGSSASPGPTPGRSDENGLRPGKPRGAAVRRPSAGPVGQQAPRAEPDEQVAAPAEGRPPSGPTTSARASRQRSSTDGGSTAADQPGAPGGACGPGPCGPVSAASAARRPVSGWRAYRARSSARPSSRRRLGRRSAPARRRGPAARRWPAASRSDRSAPGSRPSCRSARPRPRGRRARARTASRGHGDHAARPADPAEVGHRRGLRDRGGLPAAAQQDPAQGRHRAATRAASAASADDQQAMLGEVPVGAGRRLPIGCRPASASRSGRGRWRRPAADDAPGTTALRGRRRPGLRLVGVRGPVGAGRAGHPGRRGGVERHPAEAVEVDLGPGVRLRLVRCTCRRRGRCRG